MRSSRQNQNYQNTSTGTTSGTSSGTVRSAVENTPDIDALRNYRAQVDPGISHRYGSALRRMKDSFNNPLGGYATPAMKDAIMRSNERELLQQAGQEFREGQSDVNRMDLGRLSGLAELTAPRTVTSNETQTGTSMSTNQGTGQITQTPSWLSTIGGIASGAASVFA